MLSGMPHVIHTRKLVFLVVLLSILVFLSGCISPQTKNKEAVTLIMKTDSPVIDINKINQGVSKNQ